MNSNLIIIMADQLRADVLGKGFSPNIDKLFKDSLVFGRAYTACPLCVPARGAFFTGTFPNENGSLINPWVKADARHGDVRSGISNLYTLMEDNFYSLHCGKQHLYTEGGKLEKRKNTKTIFAATEEDYREFLDQNGIRRPGGSRFKMRIPEMVNGALTHVRNYSIPETGIYEPGESNYFDGYFTDKALKALDDYKEDKPLLFNMMFTAPHPPLDIPEKWFHHVKPEEVILPAEVGVWYTQQSPLQMYNISGIAGAGYKRDDWQEIWRVYLGLTAFMDDCTGRIIQALKDRDLYDNSMIIFTSDHGEMLGSHGLYQKMCMYEASSHVPLAIKMPKSFSAAAGNCDALVSHVDVMPTICEYFSLKPKQELSGLSLLPFLRGQTAISPERPIFMQYDGNGSLSNFQRAIVRDNYKLIVDYFKDEIFLELYDITNDPGEHCNLVFNSACDRTTQILLELLRQHMAATADRLTLPAFALDAFREHYEAILK